MCNFFKLIKTLCFFAIVATLSACGGTEEDYGSASESSGIAFQCLDSLGTLPGITVSWNPPSEFTNNTSLDTSQIQSFKIHLGTESGVYSQVLIINDSTANTCSFPVSETGKIFIAMSVVIQDGRESNLSDELVRSL